MNKLKFSVHEHIPADLTLPLLAAPHYVRAPIGLGLAIGLSILAGGVIGLLSGLVFYQAISTSAGLVGGTDSVWSTAITRQSEPWDTSWEGRDCTVWHSDDGLGVFLDAQYAPTIMF
jgi:hypothetical protein